MVIYFTNRNSHVIATASSELPDNKTLIDDMMTDDLASGVKTFECTVIATDLLKEAAVSGNYLLADGQLYTIISDDYDNLNQTIDLYCEDAGLDLLNRVVGEVAKTTKSFSAWIENTLGSSSSSGWKYNYGGINKSKTKQLEYTSAQTATERLLNILDNYDAEMYFTYQIEGLEWVTRTINFTTSRGEKDAPHAVYMDYDVEKIIRKRNVEDLATVWIMYGKDKKPLKSLSGYSSATKTFTKNGHNFSVVNSEVRCTDGIKNWTSELDKDGRIVQKKYTEYTTASTCIAYAIREMVKIVDPVITYEVSLRHVYDGAQCGDHVRILDAHNDILLEARIIGLKRSMVTGDTTVTLGEYTALKSSKAALTVENLSQIFSLSITSDVGTIGHGSISAVLTVTVYLNGSVISHASELPAGHLVWYEDDVEVSDSDPRITDDGFTFTTGSMTTGHTYRCVLED